MSPLSLHDIMWPEMNTDCSDVMQNLNINSIYEKSVSTNFMTTEDYVWINAWDIVFKRQIN